MVGRQMFLEGGPSRGLSEVVPHPYLSNMVAELVRKVLARRPWGAKRVVAAVEEDQGMREEQEKRRQVEKVE